MKIISTSLCKILLLTGALLVTCGSGHQAIAGSDIHKGTPLVRYKEIETDGIVVGGKLGWGFYFEQGSGVFRVRCAAQDQDPYIYLTIYDARLVDAQRLPPDGSIPGVEIILTSDTGVKFDFELAEVKGARNMSERVFSWSFNGDIRMLLGAVLNSNSDLKITVGFDAEELNAQAIIYTGEFGVDVTGPETGGRSLKVLAAEMMQTCGL